MALSQFNWGVLLKGVIGGAVVAVGLIIFYLVYSYFKKGSSSHTGKKNKKAADKKGANQNISGISGNSILIKVYKDFGSNTEILKAEYEAVETRDSFNNLISINPDFSHNQDTDFSIDDVYREMQIILEFKNKSREEKLKLLQEKIKKQDKILRYLEKYPQLNAMFNYCDENLKSRDYKILKKHITNHVGQGAYFTIENGVRVYSFMACEGYLAPIWHGIDSYTQYPDHTRKLKITVTEDMRMREEIRTYNKEQKVASLITWGLIITIVLFGINVWWAVHIYKANATMEEKLHASAFKCAELTSQLNEAYAIQLAEKLGLTNQNKAPEGQTQELKPNSIG